MAEIETVETTSNEALESTSETLENTSNETVETQEESQVDIDSIVLEALQTPSEAVQKYIDDLVKEGIKKALAGVTPKKAKVQAPIITQEQFNAMKYVDRAKLYNTNRELYNSLSKRK